MIGKRFLLMATALAALACSSIAFAQCYNGSCGDSGCYGGFCPQGYCPTCPSCPQGGCLSGSCPIPSIPAPPVPQAAAPAPDGNETAFRVSVPACRFPALVIVDCYHATANSREVSRGTGTIVDHDATGHTDIVVTCAHGYQSGDSVVVTASTGKAYRADVLAADHSLDVAVLNIRETGITPMVIASAPPARGDEIWMTGFAWGKQFMGTAGKVNGYTTLGKNTPQTYLATTCLTDQGCSGGPLINARGEVVGTVSVKDAQRGPGHCTGACLPLSWPRLKCKQIYKSSSLTLHARYTLCQVVITAGTTSPLPWRAKVEGELNSIDNKLNQPPMVSSPPAAIPPLPSVPAAPQYAGPDPAIQAVQAAIGQHAQAIDGLHNGLRDVNEKVDTLGNKVDALPKSLAQQFAENRAKEQVEEPAAPKVKQDLDALKATIGNWLYALIALLVALVVALVVWNILHGKGLFRQLIDKVAAANPQNTQLQGFAKSVDTTEDKWKSDLVAAVPFLAKYATPNQPAAGVASVAGPAAAGQAGTAAAAGTDATHAAVTAALVQGAIATALATPAPGQSQTTTSASPVGNASQPAPAAGPSTAAAAAGPAVSINIPGGTVASPAATAVPATPASSGH